MLVPPFPPDIWQLSYHSHGLGLQLLLILIPRSWEVDFVPFIGRDAVSSPISQILCLDEHGWSFQVSNLWELCFSSRSVCSLWSCWTRRSALITDFYSSISLSQNIRWAVAPASILGYNLATNLSLYLPRCVIYVCLAYMRSTKPYSRHQNSRSYALFSSQRSVSWTSSRASASSN